MLHMCIILLINYLTVATCARSKSCKTLIVICCREESTRLTNTSSLFMFLVIWYPLPNLAASISLSIVGSAVFDRVVFSSNLAPLTGGFSMGTMKALLFFPVSLPPNLEMSMTFFSTLFARSLCFGSYRWSSLRTEALLSCTSKR